MRRFSIIKKIVFVTYFREGFQCESCQNRIFFRVFLGIFFLIRPAYIFMQLVNVHQELNAVLWKLSVLLYYTCVVQVTFQHRVLGVQQFLLDGHRLCLLQAVQQVVLGCHLGEIIPMLKGKLFLFH